MFTAMSSSEKTFIVAGSRPWNRAVFDAQLAHLPAQYGFKNAKEFCKAVLSVSAKKRGSLRDPQFKESVISALKGGLKGADAARQFGLSVATIQNLKKAAGLVTARGS